MKKNPFNIFNFSGLIIFLLLFTSCKKYLEIPLPNDRISDATVFTTKPTIVSAVNGMYAAFASQTNIANELRTLYWLSDEGELSPPTGDEKGDMIIANIVAANQWFPTWTSYYVPIFRANQIIENLPGVPETILTATERNSFIGAAKYVRAVSHFNLVRAWGDVPLVLTTSTAVNSLMPRTPAAEVYGAIVKDLLEAVAELPATVNTADSRTIHNKYQALAFLSRVYLYMGKWADAEAAATQVISSNQYLMVTGVNNVFKRGSREAILSLAEVSTSSFSLNRTAIGWYTIPSSAGNATTLNCSIPASMIALFEASDQRAVNGNWITLLYTKKFANKYLHSLTATTAQVTASPQDYLFQRLAELYLIRAEARAQQDNITGTVSAAADINVVRNRAGLANTTAANKTDMLNAIEKERFCELFYEGHRWFDLKRTNRLNAVLGVVSYKATNWKPHYALWPLSPKELIANPNLIQNPGY